MKLSREWLGEYTTIGAPDKEYCDAMTMSGSKVEGWEVTGSEISRVVVGRVISMERHTNSDHMWVCKIDVGGERELQIVTGAQNVNIGDLVPVALARQHAARRQGDPHRQAARRAQRGHALLARRAGA